MSHSPSTPALSREDYAAIEAAVMETARGRWFLAEYARRNRNADTTVLLEAIARLERSLDRAETSPPRVDLRRELSDMASSIHRTKTDLAHSIAEATGELRDPAPERAFDDVVAMAEKASEATARVTGQVQEMATALRAGASVAPVASGLDRHSLELSRAAEQHALTTDRVRSIVAVLREMEERIHTIVGSWTEDPAPAERPRAEPPPPAETRASRRGPVDERETVLAATPGTRHDDLVFVDTSRWRERRTAPDAAAPSADPAAGTPSLAPPAPAPRTAERPVVVPQQQASMDTTTFVDDITVVEGPRTPFDSLEALPEIRRMVVFV